MKKIIFLLSMSAMFMTVTACGNKSNTNAAEATEVASDDSPAMQLLNSVPFTEEGLKSMIKTPEKEALTPEEFEALYLAYSKVGINEKGQNLESNFVGKVISEVSRGRKRPEQTDAIFTKLLKNSSPSVRGVVVQEFVFPVHRFLVVERNSLREAAFEYLSHAVEVVREVFF